MVRGAVATVASCRLQAVPPPPDGRPGAGDVRDRIATAARELFAAQGYERTTVEAVAERAGVSRRTFFRHFRSKDDVIFPDHERIAGGGLGASRGARGGAAGARRVRRARAWCSAATSTSRRCRCSATTSRAPCPRSRTARSPGPPATPTSSAATCASASGRARGRPALRRRRRRRRGRRAQRGAAGVVARRGRGGPPAPARRGLRLGHRALRGCRARHPAAAPGRPSSPCSAPGSPWTPSSSASPDRSPGLVVGPSTLAVRHPVPSDWHCVPQPGWRHGAEERPDDHHDIEDDVRHGERVGEQDDACDRGRVRRRPVRDHRAQGAGPHRPAARTTGCPTVSSTPGGRASAARSAGSGRPAGRSSGSVPSRPARRVRARAASRRRCPRPRAAGSIASSARPDRRPCSHGAARSPCGSLTRSGRRTAALGRSGGVRNRRRPRRHDARRRAPRGRDARRRARRPAPDPQLLRRVGALFRPYGGRLALIAVAIVVASLLGIVPPFLTQRVFDDALFLARRPRPAPAERARRAADPDPAGDRAHRRLPDLPDHRARQPRHGRPAQPPLRAPAGDGPRLLHRHEDRGHPVAAGRTTWAASRRC